MESFPIKIRVAKPLFKTGVVKLHNIFRFLRLRRVLVFLSVPPACSNFRTRCPKKAKLSHGRRIFAGCVNFSKRIIGTLRKTYIRSPGTGNEIFVQFDKIS